MLCDQAVDVRFIEYMPFDGKLGKYLSGSLVE